MSEGYETCEHSLLTLCPLTFSRLTPYASRLTSHALPHQGIGCLSRKKPPDGPPWGSIASHTAVSAA